MASLIYSRNVQGHRIRLELIEVDPDEITLDATNPRIGFSMKQLAGKGAYGSGMYLAADEPRGHGRTETIHPSVGGVQEPIYIRHDYTVAEGNRRVVALRAAKEERPDDPHLQKMPAWLIAKGTPEHVIQDLLNEIHLGSVRGWAPYEKALQMRALVKGGLIEAEVAERYRMTTSDVRAQSRPPIRWIVSTSQLRAIRQMRNTAASSLISWSSRKTAAYRAIAKQCRIFPNDLRGGYGTAT